MLDRHETRDDYRKISVGLISMTLLCFMYVSYVINFSVLFTFYPNSYIKFFIKKIHGDNPISIALRLLVIGFQLASVFTFSPAKTISEDRKKQVLQYGAFAVAVYLLMGLVDFVYYTGWFSIFISTISFSFGFYFLLEWRKKIAVDLKEDRRQETESEFDQARNKIETSYSVNIPYTYRYMGDVHTSWINIINVFRAVLLGGTPGSGKSFAILEEWIRQLIKKSFAGVIYDYKFPTLTKKTYNYTKWYSSNYPVEPKFYMINFDDPAYSHRCNPINIDSLKTIADAKENTKVLMMNINKTWIQKEGDFFSDSAMLFTSILMWYLKLVSKKYDYNVCSLPHLVALSTFESREILFLLFQEYRELKANMTPFNDAIENGALEQLAGQVASAGVALAKVSSPELDYIITGDDFSFDLNNPLAPKILCLGNNPDRQETYSAPLGLILSKLTKTLNRQNQAPSMYCVDEFPTIYIRGIDTLIGTGRSNKVATLLGFQTLAQVVADYGKEIADKIIRLCGSRVMGQMMDEDAKMVSETIGKQKVLNHSYNYSTSDISENQQVAMEDIVPPYRISQFSQGTFCGICADEFDNKESNKVFYGDVAPPLNLKKHDEDIPLPKIYDFTPENIEELVSNYLSKEENFINKLINILTSKKIGEWNEIIEHVTTEDGLDNYFINICKLDYDKLKFFSNHFLFKDNFYAFIRNRVEVKKQIVKENFNKTISEEKLSKTITHWIRKGFIYQNKKQYLLDHQKGIYNDVYRIVAMEIISLNLINVIKQKSELTEKFKTFCLRIANSDRFEDPQIKKDYKQLAEQVNNLNT